MEKIVKPWGYELIWVKTKKYVGKVLHVNAGESLALQYHKVKDEAWYMIKGLAEIQIGSKGKIIKKLMKPRDFLRIKPKTKHRIKAIKTTDIIEVSTPELDDVVRLEDKYGRI